MHPGIILMQNSSFLFLSNHLLEAYDLQKAFLSCFHFFNPFLLFQITRRLVCCRPRIMVLPSRVFVITVGNLADCWFLPLVPTSRFLFINVSIKSTQQDNIISAVHCFPFLKAVRQEFRAGDTKFDFLWRQVILRKKKFFFFYSYSGVLEKYRIEGIVVLLHYYWSYKIIFIVIFIFSKIAL